MLPKKDWSEPVEAWTIPDNIKLEICDEDQDEEDQSYSSLRNELKVTFVEGGIKEEPRELFFDEIYTDITIEEPEYAFAQTKSTGDSPAVGIKSELEEYSDEENDISIAKAQKRNRRSRTKGPHICKICGKEWKTRYNLNVHEFTHATTATLPFPCTHCDKGFTRNNRLQRHIMIVHKTSNGTSEVIRWQGDLQCPICSTSISFTNLETFTHHILTTHYKQEETNCHLCSPQQPIFSNGYDYIDHIFGHHLACKLCCGNCKQKGLKLSSMQSHMNSVHGTLKKMCDICGNWYRKLLDHKIAHVDPKRTSSKKRTNSLYSCPTCKREFSSKCNLNTHIRSHTGTKPFKCSYCKKSFAQSSYLKEHTAIHTGEKPFQCNYCTEAFNKRSKLMCHKESEHGIKRGNNWRKTSVK